MCVHNTDIHTDMAKGILLLVMPSEEDFKHDKDAILYVHIIYISTVHLRSAVLYVGIVLLLYINEYNIDVE